MRRGFLAPRQADTVPPPPPQPPLPPAFPAPGSLGPGLRFIYAPSADGCDDNLLILLHGCGDRAQPFAAFARHLRLPQTATLALEGLLEVPHSDGGRGWWQSHDAEGRLLPPEAPPRVASRAQSLARLEAALEALHASGAWPPRRVHLFGFSDGGEVCPGSLRSLLCARRPPPCRLPWRAGADARGDSQRSAVAVVARPASCALPLDTQGTAPARRRRWSWPRAAAASGGWAAASRSQPRCRRRPWRRCPPRRGLAPRLW